MRWLATGQKRDWPKGSLKMRLALVSLAAAGVLGGCMSTQGMHGGGMAHGAMSHEDMMRHCQMMREGGDQAPEHDPAMHGGMSREEMMRRCQMMQEHPSPE
jgi:hypothetical protein